MSAHDRLAGIGQLVEVEADDLKASGQFGLFLQRGGGKSHDQLLAASVLRPENKHRRTTESVHGESEHLPIRPLEGSCKRCPDDLATELVALECDHLKITGEAFLDHFLQVGDEPAVTEFKSHDHGEAQNLRRDRRVEVALDKRAQRLGTCLGIGTLLHKLSLRNEKIGLEAQPGEFVGGLGQLATGFEEGLSIFRIIVEGDELLAGAEDELKNQEAAWGVRVRRKRFLRVTNHPLHGKPVAGCG